MTKEDKTEPCIANNKRLIIFCKMRIKQGHRSIKYSWSPILMLL